MLLEPVRHHDNLPFSITFTNVAEEDNHYHKEVEIMFVLRGSTNCKIYHWNYSLTAGDVLIVDTEDLHRIYGSSEDMLMLTMYIELEYFTDTYPNLDYIIFAPEDCTQGSAAGHHALKKKEAFLKSHLAKIMHAFADKRDDSALLMEELNEFVFILVNQFQGFFIEDMQFKLGNNDASEVDQERILRIIKYIYLNYDKKITLEDLAAQEYLSTYYISHLIKKITGLNFQNFLNYTRVEFAEKLLVEGKLSLTQISEFCGFSSLAYFDKCFKTWHNMTPAEYRHRLCPCSRRYGADFTEEEAMELLRPYRDNFKPYLKNDGLRKIPNPVLISIDYASVNGKSFRKTFPLDILLNSVEDIFRLQQYEKNLIALRPSHIYIGPEIRDNILNRQTVLDMLGIFLSSGCTVAFEGERASLPDRSVHTAAEAFAYIMHKKNPCLSLFGSQGSLITKGGLFTPWYYLHEIFARVEGSIIGQGKQHMIVKSNNMLQLFVFQEDKDFGLKAHIQLNGVTERGIILEKRFKTENSCYASLRRLETMSLMEKGFAEYINEISSGVPNIRTFCQDELPTLSIDMEPGSFVSCGIYLFTS